MSDPEVLAAALAQAWRDGASLDAGAWSLPDEAAGQAVHAHLSSALNWAPAGRPQFWKCGGSSRSGPFGHAPLAPEGVRESEDLTGLSLIGAEAEIALRLKCDVTPERARAMNFGEGEDLIDGFSVAIEGLASRWQQGMAADPLLKNADCQSHGGLSLGPWMRWKPGRDWARQPCELQINGEAPMAGLGGHGLNDPAWVMVPWLQAATRHGATVPAGSVVTTGSWRVALKLRAGDLAVARFADLGEWRARL
ncbi:MAG: fumarylacetoacetate hydrolase family protein [Paucibacter sp.]|nr:fumarylacetoacetate hydrolase family protein [Roseateles sp.]